MTADMPLLAALGWQAHFAEQIDPADLSRTPPARVTHVHRTTLHILGEGIDTTVPAIPDVAVGDWVVLDEPCHMATRILDRHSLIKRRAPGHDRQVQLIAANIDTAFLVTSCNRDFNVARLERYLALAFEAGTEPVIVLTKPDLADDPEAFAAEARTISRAVPVVTVDARGGDAARALAPWCAPGRTVAFLGSSGVGKSTLVNALSGLDLATRAVRAADARGRHTTTRRELHVVPAGFALLDTPGMRELQLMDAASGIGDVFADIEAMAAACRFSDCRHDAEPGCAIRAAAASGEIDPDRLARWQKLTAEDSANSQTLATAHRREVGPGRAPSGGRPKRTR